MNVWDTTGQEKYHSVTNLFINDSHIIILVYAIDSKTSFDNLNYWYDTIEEKLRGEKYILSVVGCKYDLIEHEVVTEDEGKKYANEKNARFKLVSPKEDPDGINKLFDNLLDDLIEKNILENKKDDKYKIKKGNKKKQKKCCQ